ncbi:MAG: ribonucleotide reductase subunit alpha [Eggerthellaceae bacterium]|nr:ribonucleotide reductase subunit alpha [Eggerthellaceae bacterium]
MLESFDSNAPSRDDERSNDTAEYLERALAASDAGDAVLSMHLYLAAFEEAAAFSDVPSEDAIRGLKQAWALACQHKERALAEYIFEKLEPLLTPSETDACVAQLQGLALDRLEQFGVSREDIEEMTEMISRDLMSMGLDVDVNVGVEAIPVALPRPTESDGCCCGGCGCESSDNAEDSSENANQGVESADQFLAKAAEELAVKMDDPKARPLTYDTLAGYDSIVAIMRDYGIGLEDDPDFLDLVNMLNARHGVEGMPPVDTLLFRSPAREDANRFVAATVGELDCPAMRMHMEESLQGMPLLCVTTHADHAPKGVNLRDAFANGGVLVLENVDLWSAPFPQDADEHAKGGFLMSQLTRGAREAVNLIRAAVDNPDVIVLATAAAGEQIDDFFLDILEPLTVIDIDYPTPEERYDIWMDIAREHPSIRSVNRADLVRLSANMPRYDIYMAAREAVEEAYKIGLTTRRYRPVTRDNIFDKLAAYQPLDSTEYLELEEAVIRDFRNEIAGIDELLRGPGA